MSLLDGGPDLLLVYPEVEITDAYGNVVRVPSDTPIPVRGRVQPAETSELADLGQVAQTMIRFLGRTFPGGPWSRVEFDGRAWDLVGEPRIHRGSPRTAHVTVYMRARSA